MDKYVKEKKVGEGTYGVVYRGVQKSSGRIVAMKKIRMANYKDGISFTALREIKTLQEIKHQNVVEVMQQNL